jgi:hypothetical protein
MTFGAFAAGGEFCAKARSPNLANANAIAAQASPAAITSGNLICRVMAVPSIVRSNRCKVRNKGGKELYDRYPFWAKPVRT